MTIVEPSPTTTEPEQLTDVQLVAAKAIAYLDEHGWCKGEWGETSVFEPGARCTVGAIDQAAHILFGEWDHVDGFKNWTFLSDQASEDTQRAVRRRLGEVSIAEWNDYPERTLADVKSVLARVAAEG